jgi:hypothetical protein
VVTSEVALLVASITVEVEEERLVKALGTASVNDDGKAAVDSTGESEILLVASVLFV